MGLISRPSGLAISTTAILLAMVGASAGPARAQMSAPSVRNSATSYSAPGFLNGVAAISANDVWAVGETTDCNNSSNRTLIVHWNGKKWAPAANVKPLFGSLNAVTAVSSNDVWAVGNVGNCLSDSKTLIMHWNGSTWSRQANAPVLPGYLSAVAGARNDIWAVGEVENGSRGTYPALILHWTGGHWFVVPTDAPSTSRLEGIAVTGKNTLMTCGFSAIPVSGFLQVKDGLIYRWNGKVWKYTSAALHLANDDLEWIAGNPAGEMWVVGYNGLNGYAPVSLLWNGRSWRKFSVPTSSPGDSWLNAVSFVPDGTAWAVGQADATALVVRFTGGAWRLVTIPNSGSDQLSGVSATSPSDAWIVGETVSGTTAMTLILHWNGKTWS